MTQASYVISFNGVWLSEFQFTEDGLTPINSDVKQDAQEFGGVGIDVSKNSVNAKTIIYCYVDVTRGSKKGSGVDEKVSSK